MRFSMNSRKWVSGLLAAALALPLVGCSPEASTTATKPPATGGMSGPSKAPKEQTGSTTGGSTEKGREVPEPSPAADNAAADATDKPASDTPKEDEKKAE